MFIFTVGSVFFFSGTPLPSVLLAKNPSPAGVNPGGHWCLHFLVATRVTLTQRIAGLEKFFSLVCGALPQPVISLLCVPGIPLLEREEAGAWPPGPARDLPGGGCRYCSE